MQPAKNGGSDCAIREEAQYDAPRKANEEQLFRRGFEAALSQTCGGNRCRMPLIYYKNAIRASTKKRLSSAAILEPRTII